MLNQILQATMATLDFLSPSFNKRITKGERIAFLSSRTAKEIRENFNAVARRIDEVKFLCFQRAANGPRLDVRGEQDGAPVEIILEYWG